MSSKILIHDLGDELEQSLNISSDIQIINARLAYATCTGCYGCWLHTPGFCTMKDKLYNIGAQVMNTDEVIIISKGVYGGLSPEVKKIWDRCIPGVLPFFSYRSKRMHHARRYSHEPNITAVFYGDLTSQEKSLSQKIIEGNSINFFAKNTTVKFIKSVKQLSEVISI